jgi:hypothetical protein
MNSRKADTEQYILLSLCTMQTCFNITLQHRHFTLHKISFIKVISCQKVSLVRLRSYTFVRQFPNKTPLSYILVYTAVRSSQVPGTAKYYGDLDWRARKKTVLSTLTGLRPVRFKPLANLHHFLIYILPLLF